ncbi:hypothetical protein B566_EDAN007689 [Ephemera danica]|nr:hypothetical protein B566_EDAN007689 [Ephemera danica]
MEGHLQQCGEDTKLAATPCTAPPPDHQPVSAADVYKPPGSMTTAATWGSPPPSLQITEPDTSLGALLASLTLNFEKIFPSSSWRNMTRDGSNVALTYDIVLVGTEHQMRVTCDLASAEWISLRLGQQWGRRRRRTSSHVHKNIC